MRNPFKVLTDFIQRKQSGDVTDGWPYNFSLGGLFGADSTPVHIAPRIAYNLAAKNSSLGNAVKKISSDISSLRKGLETKKDIDYDADMIRLLNKPGGAYSAAQFWKLVTQSYLLTDETYIVARGNINRPPLELVPVRPYYIDINFSNVDGLPQFIRTTAPNDKRIYTRKEENGQMRFIDDSNMNELMPIIGDVSIQDEWRGQSSLTQLYYDIHTSTTGKRHNLSLLKNGVRVSMIVSPKQSGATGINQQKWAPDKVKKLGKDIRDFNQGASNAGNNLIVSDPMDVQGISQTNKEMDYMLLLNSTKETIYSNYNIPLPLISAESMTLDNYTVAQRAYYNDAVFPVYDDITDGLLLYLAPRYGIDSAMVTMGVDEQNIRALRTVNIENMELMKKTEATSVNEARKEGGFEKRDNADIILISSNKVSLESIVSGNQFPTQEEIDAEAERLNGDSSTADNDSSATEEG